MEISITFGDPGGELMLQKVNPHASGCFFYSNIAYKSEKAFDACGNKKSRNFRFDFLWAMRDSNPRPSGCKPDALNQLS